MEALLEALQTFLKWKDNRMTSQNLKLHQPTSPWPPSLWERISCSNLHQFEQFLLHWMHHLKLYKIFENNRVTSKDLRLQNVNWSYVTTHIMPMTPFIWRMHILFKPLSIWAIFAALVAPSKVLQHRHILLKPSSIWTVFVAFDAK